MKRNLNFALLMVLFVLTAVSCKKDKPREELLTSGSWRASSISVTLGPFTVDGYADLEDCEKDDRLTFKSDKTVEIDEGPTKCDPAAPQTFSIGTWSLSDNDNKLTYGGTTYDILELTENRLRLRGSISDSGLTGTIELGFTR